MRSRTLIAALALVVLPAAAAAQQGDPPLEGVRIAGEVAGGMLATPVGFIAGGLLTRTIALRMGAGEDAASRAAYVGAWTAAALSTAAAPTLIGRIGRPTGSYGSALVGAVAGGLASYGVVLLNRRPDDADDRPCRIGCVLGSVAVFVLPSVGATIGFNMSRRYDR